MLVVVALGMYRFQVRRTLQFDSNGLLIGWSLAVLFILFGPQSGNMGLKLTLRFLLIPRLITRDTLWIECFFPHDLLWGKNPGRANCYKIVPSPPFGEI
jgi:hypothetical protein